MVFRSMPVASTIFRYRPAGTTVNPLISNTDKNAWYASATVTLVGANTVALSARSFVGRMKRRPVMFEINRTKSVSSASSR
jgi:hypothetical protein